MPIALNFACTDRSELASDCDMLRTMTGPQC